MTRIGSLFSGYGGLDLAVQSVVGGDVAWVSDICKVNKDGTVGHYEPHRSPCTILAHHHADVPNLGDIALVDWSQVEPVDVLTGGFPCQDVSHAGKRAGLRPDTRSGLWSQMAYAIDQLRPALVVAENVRGLLSAEAHGDLEPCPWCVGDGPAGALRALGAVLGDLADLGYDAEWTGLRAADVGAPHGRFRVFVVAYPADSGRSGWRQDDPRGCGVVGEGGVQGGRHEGSSASGSDREASPVADELGHERAGSARGRRAGLPDDGLNAAHADQPGPQGPQPTPRRHLPDGRTAADSPAPDAERLGLTGRGELRHLGSPSADRTDQGVQRQRDRDAVDDRGAADWGDYGPAVRRWEHVLGRLAPAPTEAGAKGGQRLSPIFVEWMMGLPAGHVTAVPGLTRNEQLKALGNGVVPQQAAAALTHLLQPTSRKEVA